MKEKRTNYRKNLKVSGVLISENSEIPFFTKNVSLTGFKALITEAKVDSKPMEKDDLVYVRLPMLNMEGVASLVWTESTEDGGFNFGFRFLNMRGAEGDPVHRPIANPEDIDP